MKQNPWLWASSSSFFLYCFFTDIFYLLCETCLEKTRSLKKISLHAQICGLWMEYSRPVHYDWKQALPTNWQISGILLFLHDLYIYIYNTCIQPPIGMDIFPVFIDWQNRVVHCSQSETSAQNCEHSMYISNEMLLKIASTG